MQIDLSDSGGGIGLVLQRRGRSQSYAEILVEMIDQMVVGHVCVCVCVCVCKCKCNELGHVESEVSASQLDMYI